MKKIIPILITAAFAFSFKSVKIAVTVAGIFNGAYYGQVNSYGAGGSTIEPCFFIRRLLNNDTAFKITNDAFFFKRRRMVLDSGKSQNLSIPTDAKLCWVNPTNGEMSLSKMDSLKIGMSQVAGISTMTANMASDVSSKVPQARTLTFVGVGNVTVNPSSAQDLSINRTFSIVTKRQETYSGTTNASGNYVVTFGTAYSVAPNIQCQVIGASTETFFRVTSITTTGFTVNVYSRTVVGSLPIIGTVVGGLLGGTVSNVNGASVDVLITDKN